MAYLAIVAIGPGVVYVLRADYLAAMEARSADLVMVPGTLEEGRAGNESRGRRVYRVVHVRYRFKYEGRDYTGDRLCYGASKEWSYTTEELNELFEQARRDGQVDVFVDRRDPSRSVLIADRSGIITPMTVGISILGAGISLAGLLGLLIHLRKWLRGEPS